MSSGSDSDDDYKPCEPEALSEEDSADDETDLQYEKELESKKNKLKSKLDTKLKKKRKTRHVDILNKSSELIEKQTECELDPEDEKKKEDELWSKFLEGTDTKPKLKKNDEPPLIESPKIEVPKTMSQQSEKLLIKEGNDAKERRIFEFAGEKIVVEDNVIKEKIKVCDNPKTNDEPPQKRSRGGISNVLNIINKKSKLTTLEKSKLDWETYKKDEGIEDEVQNINKGKSGYLDRQDFLERTDMRQYEIERNLRLSRRSNR